MKSKPTTSELEVELTYEYYKQQREEFMNLSRERASLALQFLVILGVLGAAFLQANNDILKLGIAGVMVLLGILGFIILLGIERTMRLHVARARVARKSLGFLEKYANIKDEELPKVRGVRRDSFSFGSIFILIMVVGILFALTVILK